HTTVASALTVRIDGPEWWFRYMAEKGSITVDGISLTVVEPLDDGFTVAVIPHTAGVATVAAKVAGPPLTLEVDVIAKYAERLLEGQLAALAGSGPTRTSPAPSEE